MAPDGYETADDIVFSVGLDGSVTIDGKKQDSNAVTMKDKPSESGILFSKTKVGGGSELAGAEFSITGKTFEGKTIEEIIWTSGGGLPKQFQLQDGVYKLTETKAPVGYEKANAINFTISLGEEYVDDWWTTTPFVWKTAWTPPWCACAKSGPTTTIRSVRHR